MSTNNPLMTALTIIAPEYAMRIMRAKLMARIYSGAADYPSSDWVGADINTSANQEISAAQSKLIARSRDLARNNPYAKKAADVIVSNVIGYGIIPKITGRNDRQTKELNRLWKLLAESPKCDNENQLDFYALQELAMKTIVESGEVLAIKYLDEDGPRIQLLEPDFIDKKTNYNSSSDSMKWIDGIKVDSRNRRQSYQIFEQHPGDSYGNQTSKEIPADQVIHSYYRGRPGQLRGVPWAHSVINTIRDFDDFQYATIIRQKISACLVGVITTNGNDSLIPPTKLASKRNKELNMTPGTMRYVDPGESVTFNSPPMPNGYREFVTEIIRAIACGYGITYESLSNDYSQVNFSSGRMGHLEMRRNFEKWRWNMIIPQFCQPFMDLFLKWCQLRGVIADVTDVKCEWVPPAYQMIDPNKEILAEKEAVKAGFKSKSMVIREYGQNPDSVREEIYEERLKDSELGLKFDITESIVEPQSEEIEPSET